MGFAIRTSNEHWLNKAIELYNSRVSITIVDDAEWGICDSKDVREILSGFTLKLKGLLLVEMIIFYSLSILFAVALAMSISHHNTSFLVILLSSAGLIVCLAIPCCYLWKNKSGKIVVNDDGIDVIF
ncbi:MAG: hypothetical protein P4L45_00765 [Ignavibacteriaceae bacterium]|nr:hypothetical protein [Ignavibacteriaceae bacterium]